MLAEKVHAWPFQYKQLVTAGFTKVRGRIQK